jgi:activator of HSP90 ATPase
MAACPAKYYLEHIFLPCFYADTSGPAGVVGSRNLGGKMNHASNLAAVAGTSSRRQMLVGATIAFGGLAMSPIKAWASAEEGISHTAESIHQEPVFKASRKRLYEALTDAKQFSKVTQLSAAMQSGTSLGNRATEISHEVGGAFTLFGGHIVGRHIELMPNERIVQAWRVVDWNPGVYSIVKFELTEQGSGTKLVFDHAGFPQGKGQHLADGWRANYWEPLEKYLA